MSYAACLSSRTGLPLSAGFGLVTHFYNQENGLVPPKAAKLCTIMDYIAMILIGDTAPVIDPSNASGLGFFDRKRLTFDRPALYQAGIHPGRQDPAGWIRQRAEAKSFVATDTGKALQPSLVSFSLSGRSRFGSLHLPAMTLV